jgi:hypothetical protein
MEKKYLKNQILKILYQGLVIIIMKIKRQNILKIIISNLILIIAQGIHY